MSNARLLKAGVVFFAMAVIGVVAFMNEDSPIWKAVLAVAALIGAGLGIATILAFRKVRS